MPTPPGEWDDRQLSSNDLKQRIIRMEENPFVVPDVAWDAQPVRYFKLNLQWCKILAGWLEWMEDVAGWQDAEDDLHAGIQGFLAFERGINGGIFMTPDEFKQALRDGLYQWSNDVAKQIVSGTTFGFSVDEDGNVVPGGDSPGADAPEDDPDTPENEATEYRSGLALNWAHGLNSVIKKLYSLYGTDATADTPMAQAQFIMKSLYVVNDALAFDSAIQDYYGIREVSAPHITDLIPTELAEAIYCNNFALTSIPEYVLNMGGDYNARKVVIDLLRQMEETQYNIWSLDVEPSTAYLVYDCVPVADEIITLDMSTNNFPQKTTNAVHKIGHRLLFEISGKFTDSDVPNEEQDFFYHVNTSTGVKTFSPSLFQFQASIITEPTQAQVPYQPSGVYRLTIDLHETGANTAIIIGRDNGGFNLPNVSGIITLAITDLGQYLD